MSCENVFKDILVLHARLFDHRPIVQGHTNYFVKEFEEKRGDRETARLEKALNGLHEMNQMLPGMTTVLADCFTDIAQKASSSTQICKRICDGEAITQRDFLKKQRELRSEEWTEFIKQQVEKSAAVDEEFEQQVTVVKDHYTELERKLLSSV